MFKKKNKYKVAIAGATGAAGKEMVEILEERNFPVSDLVLLASEESEAERLEFHGRSRPVKKLEKDSFKGVDIAFFSLGSEASLQFAPAAVKSGAVVIDDSGAFSAGPQGSAHRARSEPGTPYQRIAELFKSELFGHSSGVGSQANP